MKYLKFIFSRLAVVAIAIIIQIVMLILLIERLNEFYAYVSLLLSIISIFFAFNVLNRNMNPDYKVPWLMIILGLPLIGIVLYFLFSKNHLTKKQECKMKKIKEKNSKYTFVDSTEDERNRQCLKEYYGQNKYIENTSKSKASLNNKLTYFKKGEEFFEDLVIELNNAKKFIFMEYFIIEKGKMFNTIIDILSKKVLEGVDVRLIYDDVGSASKIRKKDIDTIRKQGIKCVVFNPFIPVISGIHNNRDHRKITVIDGVIGYTGGINLADEYINEVHPYGVWKDSAIKLCGESVKNLTLSFLNTYEFITNQDEDYDKYLDLDYISYPDKGMVNFFNDGPSPIDNELIGENVYINIVNNAKEYVYITTPYLIIDYNFISAIRNAVFRGVDVRIITPGIPDKKMIYNLTRSHYKELLNVGVKIYEYTPGFIHAKNFIADDKIGVVGTINLDYRSLVHHYECATWIYDNDVINDIKDDFINTLNECKEVDKNFKLKPFIRLINYFLKFFTPLL